MYGMLLHCFCRPAVYNIAREKMAHVPSATSSKQSRVACTGVQQHWYHPEMIPQLLWRNATAIYFRSSTASKNLDKCCVQRSYLATSFTAKETNACRRGSFPEPPVNTNTSSRPEIVLLMALLSPARLMRQLEAHGRRLALWYGTRSSFP